MGGATLPRLHTRPHFRAQHVHSKIIKPAPVVCCPYVVVTQPISETFRGKFGFQSFSSFPITTYCSANLGDKLSDLFKGHLGKKREGKKTHCKALWGYLYIRFQLRTGRQWLTVRPPLNALIKWCSHWYQLELCFSEELMDRCLIKP